MNILEFMSGSPVLTGFIVFWLVVGGTNISENIFKKCECQTELEENDGTTSKIQTKGR